MTWLGTFVFGVGLGGVFWKNGRDKHQKKRVLFSLSRVFKL